MLLEKTRQLLAKLFIQTEESPRSILVAVSGGIDSVVLLHLLHRLSDEQKIRLGVAHFHHGMRAEEADGDQRLVQRLAEEAGLPFYTKKENVASYRGKDHSSIQSVARDRRYMFLRSVMKAQGYRYLATGHNADDQAETVIFRILRGTGLRGLVGMRPVVGDVVRPLIGVSRSDIRAYAREHDLAYREDSSNLKTDYSRNWIRHELFPMLRHGGFRAAPMNLIHLSNIAHEADEYLLIAADKALDQCMVAREKAKIALDIQTFLGYFTIIKKYIVFRALQRIDIPPEVASYRDLDAVLRAVAARKSGSRIQLGQSAECVFARDSFALRRLIAAEFDIPLQVGKKRRLSALGLTFRSSLLPAKDVEPRHSPSSLIAHLDHDLMPGQIRIRNPRPGDRFRPLGMAGTKKLSDYFIDEHIPIYDRWDTPILECDAGIVWVCGMRIDDRFKVTGTTVTVLRVEIQKESPVDAASS